MIHLLSNDWLKRKGLSKRSEDSRDAFLLRLRRLNRFQRCSRRRIGRCRLLRWLERILRRLHERLKRQRVKSASASVSIAAQSAPADFVHEGNLACVTAAAAADDDEQFQIVPVSPVTPEVSI